MKKTRKELQTLLDWQADKLAAQANELWNWRSAAEELTVLRRYLSALAETQQSHATSTDALAHAITALTGVISDQRHQQAFLKGDPHDLP